jgi:protein-S-isoprenylcysteine O-methyltransferase Ste14
MYVAVVIVLLGWAIGFRSTLLSAYALAVFLAFHLRVVFGEEPWLAKTHGEAWTRYVREVPRWLGVPPRSEFREHRK